MDEIDKYIKDFIKLKECCDWNGFDFIKTPAYKGMKKCLIKEVRKMEIMRKEKEKSDG